MKSRILSLILMVSGSLSAMAQPSTDSMYNEQYKQQYHFSPRKGWIGDPSGLMYYQGKYHLLLVSVNWAQEQYFIGDFDGKTFKLMDGHPTAPLCVDKGLDYYASRTFRDYDGTQREVLSLGWVATWDYAQQVPSTYGKGFWSVPRRLELKKIHLALSQMDFFGAEEIVENKQSY